MDLKFLHKTGMKKTQVKEFSFGVQGSKEKVTSE